MKRVGIFFITVALVAGMVGCVGVKYDLTIASTSGGSVTTPGEGTFTYAEGEVVNLAAKPDEGYRFVNWTGDVGEIADVEDATTTITMRDDYSITAKFAFNQHSLTTRSTEGGAVTTPGENAYSYDKGEVVNLAAVADEGYQFINWTGDVGTIADVNSASTTIVMNGDYTITASFAKGISDWYDLDAIRDNLDGSYILMNDLDSTTLGYGELAGPTANGGKGWQPIGSFLSDPYMWDIVDTIGAFTGNLDGREFQIRDLFVNRPDEDAVGLFCFVAEEGVIQNLGVVNIRMTGHVHVGAMVGDNWGSVITSYSSGSMTGDEFVGGLAGSNYGTVSNSYSTVSVIARANTGGLVGMNYDGAVINSYSSGSVSGAGYCAGGLVGLNYYATVSDSYSSGSVIGYEIGGLVGRNWGIIANSHYDYDEVLLNGNSVITVGALFDEDFDLWVTNDKFLDINERLSQEDGYYVIDDISDFKQLLAFGQDGSLKFRLTSNLDLAEEPNFYIPYLAGEFDGSDHKISNVNVNLDFVPTVGLFGCLASGGKVTQVGVENANLSGYDCVGGLVGVMHYGTVSKSYSTGRVTGKGSVGGLVGFIHWGTVSDSYSMSNVTCTWLSGGLVGDNSYGTVSNSHYNYDQVFINGENMITVGALFDEDFQEWLGNDRFLDVSERLSRQDGYYVINSVGDFKQLLAFGQDGSLKFRLTTDLNLSSEPNFYIPYLAGEFDGHGHTIGNLSLSLRSVSAVGLFGYLASHGIVNGLSVEDVDITGSFGVGGLVGSNRWGSTVSNSRVIGTVAGSSRVGGLVGWNDGAVSDAYSSGSVIGESDVGGLVGPNAGPVRNSYSTASVTGKQTVGGLVALNWFGGLVSRSYSSGSVTGEGNVGGLVGVNSQGTVSDSFWNTQTSGLATSDGGTGKTTAEMKNITTFSAAGWNIVAVANPGMRNTAYAWNIIDGQTYPFVSWQGVA